MAAGVGGFGVADAGDGCEGARIKQVVQQFVREVHNHSDKRLSAIAPDVRDSIRQALHDGCGYNHPAHRDRLRALHAAERAMLNRDSGYWIASDDPRAATHSLTDQYNLANTAVRHSLDSRDAPPGHIRKLDISSREQVPAALTGRKVPADIPPGVTAPSSPRTHTAPYTERSRCHRRLASSSSAAGPRR